MNDFEKIQIWFLKIRQKMVYKPAEIIKEIFKKKIDNNSFQVLCLGGFDEKVCVIYSEDISSALICSIDKKLKDTVFYEKYSQRINFSNIIDDFAVICNLNSQFFGELCSPKIALLSLAKNDVYTFPRFALGISDIAHSIRKNFQGTVGLYDLQLNSNIDDFISDVKNRNVDIIGISMTFGLFDVLEEVLQSIKIANLKCSIVVGGSLASLTYKEILKKYPEVVVSLGEGESFFVKFIDYFNGKITLKDIPDAAFVDNKSGEIFLTSQSKFCKSAKLSVPELDLLIPTIKSKGVFQIETSRGCYNSCTFCPRKQKGMWRGNLEDIEKVETLIDHFCHRLKSENYNPSKFIIYIVDEEFVGGETPLYQNRAVKISEIFAKHDLKYETSFRMNTIFSEHLSHEKKIKKINSVMKLRDNGLNRTLVGVESGVESVLKRFNKNVTSNENVTGIRLLTGLNVPIRFTYITFDPLMSFEELKETYFFQGRTDLILKTTYRDDAEKLLDAVQNENEVRKISKNIPFYYSIPYMLVSIECLLGSEYLKIAIENNLGTDNIITALGKQEVHYLDKRIEKMSKYSQLWIDKNFAIDYSLKSLSKIYSGEASLNIRKQRVLLKTHAYQLLGKMLYIIEQNSKFLKNCSEKEIEFVEDLRNNFENINDLDEIFKKLLNHQFEILVSQIFILKENLKADLSFEDFNKISIQINNWEKSKNWVLIHNN